MKQRLFAALAASALLTATAGMVLADPISGPNPGNPQAANSNNCIAVFSSGVTANGQAAGGTLGQGNNTPGQTGPAHGARGEEIKGLQATCNQNR
jgi:hypothetical protein